MQIPQKIKSRFLEAKEIIKGFMQLETVKPCSSDNAKLSFHAINVLIATVLQAELKAEDKEEKPVPEKHCTAHVHIWPTQNS